MGGEIFPDFWHVHRDRDISLVEDERTRGVLADIDQGAFGNGDGKISYSDEFSLYFEEQGSNPSDQWRDIFCPVDVYFTRKNSEDPYKDAIYCAAEREIFNHNPHFKYSIRPGGWSKYKVVKERKIPLQLWQPELPKF